MIYSSVMRKNFIHRIISLILMFTVIGVSPGVFELINMNALYAVASSNTEKDSSATDLSNPFAVSVPLEVEHTAVADVVDISESDEEELKKKEMSKFESIAWSIGKAMLPTLAVMAFSAAVACPLAWVVIGAVLVGAATSGALTLAHEMRKNSFKSEGEKKTMDKIMREVSIQAAISGVMAPFGMATAGLAQTIGPITAKTIMTAAAKAGALSFAGSTVSNVTKGAVTNLWYKHYYNYDEQEKYLKSVIETLSAKEYRTEEEDEQLVAAIKELDIITQEKYTFDNFLTDEKKALVSAGISGILGGSASRFGAESDWAKVASSKIFGTTAKAGVVANAVISNPFAFATGAANASVDKKEILNQVELNNKLQLKYEEGSAAWNYYDAKIADLEDAYKKISLSEAGRQALINNVSTQLAVVGTSIAKTRLWDLPSAKRKQIQAKYEEQDPTWKQASEVRQEYETLRSNKPDAADYGTEAEYTGALREYSQRLESLRVEYKQAKVEASNYQDSPAGKAKVAEISEKVTIDIQYQRQSELAKALGHDSYVSFKMEELSRDPKNEGISNQELRMKAEADVLGSYQKAATKNSDNLQKMDSKLDRQNMALLGEIEKGEDGKTYVVVRDDSGNMITRSLYEGGKGATFVDKTMTSSAEELRQREIDNVVKEAYNSSAMIKPSAYKGEYMKMRLNELRAQGFTEKQIDGQLSGIADDASEEMYKAFGGSWQNIAKSEILASGLERAEYDDGAAPDMNKIMNFLKTELSSRTVSTVQSQLKSGFKEVVPNVIEETDLFREINQSRDEKRLRRVSEAAAEDYYNNKY